MTPAQVAAALEEVRSTFSASSVAFLRDRGAAKLAPRIRRPLRHRTDPRAARTTRRAVDGRGARGAVDGLPRRAPSSTGRPATTSPSAPGADAERLSAAFEDGAKVLSANQRRAAFHALVRECVLDEAWGFADAPLLLEALPRASTAATSTRRTTRATRRAPSRPSRRAAARAGAAGRPSRAAGAVLRRRRWDAAGGPRARAAAAAPDTAAAALAVVADACRTSAAARAPPTAAALPRRAALTARGAGRRRRGLRRARRGARRRGRGARGAPGVRAALCRGAAPTAASRSPPPRTSRVLAADASGADWPVVALARRCAADEAAAAALVAGLAAARRWARRRRDAAAADPRRGRRPRRRRVGGPPGSGWFAEAEPAPSDIDSHATSHVSVRAPPPLPDDDASARTSAVSRESSFRGSFRGSFRASSRGSLYRGGSSRGSMRSSMYQGKRLTMKRTSTILEPFIVQCGGEDELDAEHAKPSLEFATLLGEIARAEGMHVAAQINFIVRAAEKADDEAKFKKQCKELRGKRHVFDANGDAVLLPGRMSVDEYRGSDARGSRSEALEAPAPDGHHLWDDASAWDGRSAAPTPRRRARGDGDGGGASSPGRSAASPERSAALGDHRDRHGNNVIVAYAGPKRSRPPSRAVRRADRRAALDLRFAASFVDDASELTIASTLNLVPGFVDMFAGARAVDGGDGGGGERGGDERDENLSLISRSDWGQWPDRAKGDATWRLLLEERATDFREVQAFVARHEVLGVVAVALIERVGDRVRGDDPRDRRRDDLRRAGAPRRHARRRGLLALLKAGGVVEVFFETTGKAKGQSDDFWFRLGATLEAPRTVELAEDTDYALGRAHADAPANFLALGAASDTRMITKIRGDGDYDVSYDGLPPRDAWRGPRRRPRADGDRARRRRRRRRAAARAATATATAARAATATSPWRTTPTSPWSPRGLAPPLVPGGGAGTPRAAAPAPASRDGGGDGGGGGGALPPPGATARLDAAAAPRARPASPGVAAGPAATTRASVGDDALMLRYGVRFPTDAERAGLAACRVKLAEKLVAAGLEAEGLDVAEARRRAPDVARGLRALELNYGAHPDVASFVRAARGLYESESSAMLRINDELKEVREGRLVKNGAFKLSSGFASPEASLLGVVKSPDSEKWTIHLDRALLIGKQHPFPKIAAASGTFDSLEGAIAAHGAQPGAIVNIASSRLEAVRAGIALFLYFGDERFVGVTARSSSANFLARLETSRSTLSIFVPTLEVGAALYNEMALAYARLTGEKPGILNRTNVELSFGGDERGDKAIDAELEAAGENLVAAAAPPDGAGSARAEPPPGPAAPPPTAPPVEAPLEPAAHAAPKKKKRRGRGPAAPPEISDYEDAAMRNIAAGNRKLYSLGLIQPPPEAVADREHSWWSERARARDDLASASSRSSRRAPLPALADPPAAFETRVVVH
ncbi:hypothetical protein JL720_7087 [Aureococcus anophagefferens]|nr:hypothetical protein JL720_7087 [Aureococcus anophagefferens]